MRVAPMEKCFMVIVSRVMALYAELDQQVARFQLETGLECPFGCGLCCPTARVYATVLEMLPAAAEILRRGAEAYWLDRISRAPSAPGCVLYQTDRPEDAPGHCGFYTWRSAVCRLFGFAAVHNRSGEQVLAACKHLKILAPSAVATAMVHSASAPHFSNVSAMLYAIDPTLGNRLIPINEALQEALHRMGLYQQMAEQET
jgi:uncharacterized protein